MKSWDEVKPEPLVFPIGGKFYTAPEVNYQTMLLIQKVRAGEPTPELDKVKPEDTWSIILGDMWGQMIADNVPAEAMGRVGLCSLVDQEVGREAAESLWEHGADPKAIAAGILERIGQPQPNSTGEVSVTPPLAVTNGTTSPQGSSSKRRPVKKPASPTPS